MEDKPLDINNLSLSGLLSAFWKGNLKDTVLQAPKTLGRLTLGSLILIGSLLVAAFTTLSWLLVSMSGADLAPGEAAPPRQSETKFAAPSQEPFIYVLTPQGGDGAVVGTRVRAVLQARALRMTGEAGAANSVVEIMPPTLEPAESLVIGGSANVSVIAALEARVRPGGGSARAPQLVQSRAKGLAATDAEARRQAISEAADRLGERIADFVRPGP